MVSYCLVTLLAPFVWVEMGYLMCPGTHCSDLAGWASSTPGRSPAHLMEGTRPMAVTCPSTPRIPAVTCPSTPRNPTAPG